EVYEDFADVGTVAQSEDPSIKPTTPADNIKAVTAWMAMLKVDGNNAYVKSYENVLIALENDPQLKGRFYMNTFTKRPMAIAPLPWGNRKAETAPFEWTDADDDGLLIYIEKLLGIRTKTIVTSALNECWAQHPFHPVIDYLSHLKWDGIPRLEFLFQTYLGAEDNAYVRALSKMSFVAAITRIFSPGTKFDTAVVFVGPQGLGKTTFIRTMAKFPEWYTDNIQTLDRSAIENIQGTWLVELGELSALKKNEVEEIKSFMSRQVDRARLSYGKYAVSLPRTCIFFGTTNTYSFLKDSTGERRFYPVDVGVVPPSKSVIYDLPNEVDQLWAEALYFYNLRTPLILSPELLTYAKTVQEDHYERSEKQGLIEEFLSKPVPVDWDSYTLDQRLLFYADTTTKHDNLVERTKVCAMEIWCECFGGKKEYYKSSTGWELNAILRKIPGWVPVNAPRKFPIYGSQRGFRRDDST
ncbi:MAG: VapE domain-containing protein, partial [Huintestinicola sp.]